MSKYVEECSVLTESWQTLLIGLNKECSIVVLRKLPPKLKDLGSIPVSCTIGYLQVDRTLCDLGAIINLTHYSLYKKLGLQEPQPTNIYLLLVDKNHVYLLKLQNSFF